MYLLITRERYQEDYRCYYIRDYGQENDFYIPRRDYEEPKRINQITLQGLF